MHERLPRIRHHHWFRSLQARLAVGVAVAALLAGPAAPSASRAESGEIPAQLRDQIQSLRDAKTNRSAPERKLSARLLQSMQMWQGQRVAERVPALRTGVEVAPDGSVLVDLRATVGARLLGRIDEVGGEVIGAFPRFDSVRARVPLAALANLSELAEVRGIRPADRAYTHKDDTSEGDVGHRADAARSTLGVDGAGITIGVLSDGADSVAARQASGDLPASVTLLAGQAGGGDEGTAMLEIVFDLAPGADLLFATGTTGQAQMATNVLALRAAGADVIVDDIGYFAESVFQDDDIASAVDTVRADGALYFSSAGNSGNFNDNTAGVWEGDYAASTVLVNGEETLDFGGNEFGVAITEDSPFAFTLHWSDENDASGNDYDLLLVDPTVTTVLAASTTVQDGDDRPFEFIDSNGIDDTGNRLIVVRNAGAAARFMHLNANRGDLAITTDGQTSGHSAARGSVSVAAVDARTPGGAGGVFDGSEPIETFSSDGPRRVFYEADGTVITPGDLSATGGELRAKPEITAADCVQTASPGFSTFCGTSAAAPHVAAIAALLLEQGASPEVALQALFATALDIEAVGVDFDSGFGIASADGASALVDVADCGDGLDNDADGFVDFPADPGCADTSSDLEDPQCQDGIDNDGLLGTDFDGGESILGVGNGDPNGADPQCQGSAARRREAAASSGCGLGGGAGAVAIALLVARGRRRSTT